MKMENMNESYKGKQSRSTNMICPMCNNGTIVKRTVQYGLYVAEIEICDNCGWLVNPTPNIISDIREEKQEEETI